MVAAGLLTVLSGCVEPDAVELSDEEYLAHIESWKSEREAELRREDGWLTLVGLFWLEEGANSLGSDPSSDVVFPATTDLSLGELQLEGGVVTIKTAEGAGIEHAGEQVTEMVLQSDADGDPTVLELGSLTFYVIDRGERFGVRVKDSAAKALTTFSGMEYFPVDRSWRIEAQFGAYDEPRTMLVPNVIGTAMEEPVPGVVSFERDGRKFELTPVGEPGDPLFFVFGDLTNGDETYGGGRFLTADWPGDGGVVILDFNLAYNPPCVFSPYATCPLPAAENKLALAIAAGEKAFGSGH
jgi:uncharacterized protein (DUF1684 family)